VHSGPKHKFCIFLHSEGIENAEKHSQSSFWVQCSRMDALVTKSFSQLRYPTWCIQARNTSITSFVMLKVSEMIRNTLKHYFGSNGVEWMLRKFRAPNKCIQARNTSFSSFHVRRLAKWSKTQPNIFLGLIEYIECIATSIPRNSAFRPETKISHLFTLRRFAKCSKNVPIIILGALHLVSF
jgi:hypothetical protein